MCVCFFKYDFIKVIFGILQELKKKFVLYFLTYNLI